MSKVVNDLIRKGYLKSERIIDAFSEISRIEFVPEELELQFEANFALPIGFGRMIHQPQLMAVMLELLDPRENQRILNVGSASGWTAALLAFIVGNKGKVVSLEKIQDLMEIGRKNTDKFGYVKDGRAEFFAVDEEAGYSALAPYDRILVLSEKEMVPKELKKQLKLGGKMVVPVMNSLWFLEKKGEDDFLKEEYPGFSLASFINKTSLK